MKFSGIFWSTSHQSSIYIMVEGWAVQNNSLFFKNFIDKMIIQGFDDFIIDLLECRGMDSTFMGTLLCIINQVHTKAPVTLINVSDNNQKLLDNLGLNNILNISKKSIEIPKSNMFQVPEESDFLFENKLQLIKDAHESLMNINEKNYKLFIEFIRTLQEEIQN